MAAAGGFVRSASLRASRSLQALQLSSLAGKAPCSSTYAPCLTFAPGMNGCGEMRIGPLCVEHQEKGRLFYGIEVLARTRLEPVELDFTKFLPVLPIFVTGVWHSLRFWNVEPVGLVDVLVLLKLLAPRIPTMPHLTCYRMPKQRMEDYLALNFKNLLALRGDDVEPCQDFKYALDMIKFAKSRKGDQVSVAVAGFPDGYTKEERSPEDMAKNLDILKQKIAAGADCVITQMCYKAETILKYVKDCRAEGVTVPILIGIMGHDTYESYKKMKHRGEAELPPELEQELEQLQCQFVADPNKQPDLITRFFVRVNVRLICEVLAGSEDIWGIVFFTINRFGNVHLTLKELHSLGLFDDP